MTSRRVRNTHSLLAFQPSPLVLGSRDRVRSLALWDPQASVIKSRVTLETLVDELERHHRLIYLATPKNLSERITSLQKKGVISRQQEKIMHSIRNYGNLAAHGAITSPQSAALSIKLLEELIHSFLQKR